MAARLWRSMSTLTLVRHGQATPFEDVKDRLSTLGETQARKLGEFWTRLGVVFDEVYTGTLVRQQRTAEIVGAVYADAGMSWPAAQRIEELNEYDVDGISSQLVPLLAEQDAQFRELIETSRANRHGPDRNRHFQRMFEAVMKRWMEGSIEADGVEPWKTFRNRVRGGLERISTNAGGGKRVVAFTSGGPIGVSVQLALAAPDTSGLEVNWRVRNCSLTEFVFSQNRFSLDSFNAMPHLDDPGLWSYR